MLKKCIFGAKNEASARYPLTQKIIKRPQRIKRPRGAPGPRKQLSVRFELSVRVVTPSSNSFKNQWKSMKISIFGPKIIKRPLRIKRPRGAPGSRKQLSVRCELSVREVAPDRRRSEPIHQKRSFPEFSRSLLIAIRNDESLLKMTGKITKKPKNLSVRCELSVREVPPDPENN